MIRYICFRIGFLACLVAGHLPLLSQKQYEWKETSSNGYRYRYVTNDPSGTRFYRLSNGLSVILSENHKEPRIVYRMVVRAGSNQDPKDHTGLAHYLEHLLFKGTDKYGTLDWSKEMPLIDTITALYEQYNKTTDSATRASLYREIDRVSGVASRFAVSGEYIKMMNDIGSQRTNAHTSVEETVYEEDFPSTAIDKFLTAQAERFRNPVFRLFHTELETVYEEKNRSMDNDAFLIADAQNSALFPTHNYGQQSTIGTIEHLKNPSLVAIRNFYNTYYVPNNMGIILCGDFRADELIKKVDDYFSYMTNRPFPVYSPGPEAPIQQPVPVDVFSNTSEAIRLSFRTPSYGQPDALALETMAQVLFNQKAGIIDLNVNRKQKAISAFAALTQMKDYGTLTLGAMAKPGQSLDEVRAVLLEQISNLKAGRFDDSLLTAILANKKLGFYTNIESSTYRALGLTSSFVKDRAESWDQEISETERMSRLSKQDIIEVANKYLGTGYVIVYKRKGENRNRQKVEKPPITPVVTNSDKQSEFLKKFIALPVTRTQPQWLDFSNDFQRSKTGPANILYVQNKENGRFRLHFRFEMGSLNDRFLVAAAQFLNMTGTSRFSAEQISRAFYNMGCSFNMNVQPESMAINISGLEENFSKAVSLTEELLANCLPDESALAGLKARMMSSRNSAKNRKETIMNGLMAYAKYGFDNPFNYVLSNEEIQGMTAKDLSDLLHSLTGFKHEIIYYGPAPLDSFITRISSLHPLPASFTAYPERKKFVPQSPTQNQVLFADYNMVQAEINWIRNGNAYSPEKDGLIKTFNYYFGVGGSSVVFQHIRESKALAYSTNASWHIPYDQNDLFSFSAYVGCQADKFNEAITGMNELLFQLPLDENALSRARLKRKTDIETERTDGIDFIFAYLNERSRGSNTDSRKTEYESLDKITLKDLADFSHEQFAGKAFTYCIVAQEGKVKWEDMQKLGEVKKLSLEDIFGY